MVQINLSGFGDGSCVDNTDFPQLSLHDCRDVYVPCIELKVQLSSIHCHLCLVKRYIR